MKIYVQCDKCGTTATVDDPRCKPMGWMQVNVAGGSLPAINQGYNPIEEYTICPGCSSKVLVAIKKAVTR